MSGNGTKKTAIKGKRGEVSGSSPKTTKQDRGKTSAPPPCCNGCGSACRADGSNWSEKVKDDLGRDVPDPESLCLECTGRLLSRMNLVLSLLLLLLLLQELLLLLFSK